MKHPFRDRLLMLLYALLSLCGAAALIGVVLDKIHLATINGLVDRAIASLSQLHIPLNVALVAAAVILTLFALLLLEAMIPARKKRSSNFAIQQNENGMVRISLKAIDALVQKCLNQHGELKVVTSSLYSDEETVRVDVHISLQTDISMPLAISSLQKQIKKYVEACSGVNVKEVRVFVDGTIPAGDDIAQSPYAIPASLLGINEQEALPEAADESETQIPQTAIVEPETAEYAAADETEPVEVPAMEETAAEEEGEMA